ncbi:MAG: aspartyl protease family protein [Prevotella sp.]|jgi:hypothetical protein|nr:aspartyl protease family protein [Prevotella sp.]
MRVKNTILLLIFLLSSIYVCTQTPDERVGDLLNRADYIELNRQYPSLKDSIHPMLKGLSEAVLSSSLNRPERALDDINRLLEYHQQEIGFMNVQAMFLKKCMVQAEMGNYSQAANDLQYFMNEVSEHMDSTMLKSYKETYAVYDKMRSVPPPALERPLADCEIPIEIDSLSVGGQLIYVPVTINGSPERFIFDTGCPGGAFISEEYASKLNLRTVADSVMVNGVGRGIGKIALIDSLRVGNIVYKNSTAVVVPPNPAVDSVFKVDLVLGSGIMKASGEVRIFPQEKKLVFPISQTPLPPTGNNMIFLSDHPYIEAYSNTERLIMHFDTGNAGAGLHYKYYEKHKEMIDKEGKKESKLSGGFGAVIMKDIYRLPVFPLKVGVREFELKNLEVNLDPVFVGQGNEDGSLGMAFIMLFDKVVINFDKMFLEVE